MAYDPTSRIEQDKHGVRSFVGPEAVNIFRMRTILSGLRLEIKGIRLTRKAPSCFSIVKAEYGLKGRNKQAIVEAFEALLHKAEGEVKVVNLDAEGQPTKVPAGWAVVPGGASPDGKG